MGSAGIGLAAAVGRYGVVGGGPVSAIHTAIREAERVWRTANEANDRIGSLRTYRAEESAWDRYAALCDEAQQCLQVGCRATCTDWAYCPKHRAR
jgi:hypothetical protein